MLHMDTCKMQHEDNAQKSNSVSISNLLKADSLEGRADKLTEEEKSSPSPRNLELEGNFEVIGNDEKESIPPMT